MLRRRSSARASSLPSYEASHELDQRGRRMQQAELPKSHMNMASHPPHPNQNAHNINLPPPLHKRNHAPFHHGSRPPPAGQAHMHVPMPGSGMGAGPQISGFPMNSSWGPPARGFSARVNTFNVAWKPRPQGPAGPQGWGGGGSEGGGRPPVPSSLPQRPTGLPPRPGLQPPGFSNGPRRMDRSLSQSNDTGGLNYD